MGEVWRPPFICQPPNTRPHTSTGGVTSRANAVIDGIPSHLGVFSIPRNDDAKIVLILFLAVI